LWKLWKPFCGFQGAVDAFCASTAPAATTGGCEKMAEAVAPSRTPGVARAIAAPGVDLCLGGESVVLRPVGNRASERQYRADEARRLAVIKEG
jgi:hypothetical protein